MQNDIPIIILFIFNIFNLFSIPWIAVYSGCSNCNFFQLVCFKKRFVLLLQFYIDPAKLLPLQRFLPRPPGEKGPPRGRGGGRGGGRGRGFRGGGGGRGGLY